MCFYANTPAGAFPSCNIPVEGAFSFIELYSLTYLLVIYCIMRKYFRYLSSIVSNIMKSMFLFNFKPKEIFQIFQTAIKTVTNYGSTNYNLKNISTLILELILFTLKMYRIDQCGCCMDTCLMGVMWKVGLTKLRHNFISSLHKKKDGKENLTFCI